MHQQPPMRPTNSSIPPQNNSDIKYEEIQHPPLMVQEHIQAVAKDITIKQQQPKHQQIIQQNKMVEQPIPLKVIDLQCIDVDSLYPSSHTPLQEEQIVQPVVAKPRKIIRRTSKQRKIRTVITKERLIQMNRIFSDYLQSKQNTNSTFWSLKGIAKFLGLGYSTILHKYREYRANKRVKAGALITCTQMKRKYKKSLLIEQMITKVMGEREFFTALEMTQYIQNRYGHKFSRSIISRHLGQMGYSYKNISRSTQENSTNCKYEQLRRIYAQILWPLIQTNETLIFIDQLSCCLTPPNSSNCHTVSVLLACTVHGVLFFHLQEGFFNRFRFGSVFRAFINNLRASPLCQNIQGKHEELHLVMDLNSIHRDNKRGQPGIADLLIQGNAEMYYIPPCSPQLNPVQGVFEQVRERLEKRLMNGNITSYRAMWNCLQEIVEQVQRESTQDYFVEMYGELRKYFSGGKGQKREK